MTAKTDPLSPCNLRLRRSATYASAAVAAVLIAAKLAAYFLSDSVAMLSSLLDSTIDLMASLVTIYGVASAMRPPDHDHRFGHGKAEPLAALAQAAFIAGSAVLLGYEALYRFFHPHSIEAADIAYIVTAVAVVLTLALVGFQHFVTRRTGSMAIGADKMHYIGDLAVNLAVAAAFALHQWTGYDWFDPAFAMLIASGLAANAFLIALKALDVLMDHELPDAERARIMGIVRGHGAVRNLHDLRTRSDSDRAFIEFHVELDAGMTLKAAHEVSEAIVSELRKAYPHADVLIRQDPAGVKEERLDQRIEAKAAGK